MKPLPFNSSPAIACSLSLSFSLSLSDVGNWTHAGAVAATIVSPALIAPVTAKASDQVILFTAGSASPSR